MTDFAKECLDCVWVWEKEKERQRAGESDFVLYQVSINVIGSNDFYANSNKVKSADRTD